MRALLLIAVLSPLSSGCDTGGGDSPTSDETTKKNKKKKKSDKKKSNSKKKKSEKAKGSTAPASSSAAPAKDLPAFGTQTIAEGKEDGIWLGAYAIERVKGDEGKSFLAAADHCQSRGKMLCSEAQWEKACKAHDAIGKLASWTVSFDGDDVIVRGGSSCDDRKTVPGGETSSERVAFCCDRAIAIRPSLDNPSFAKAAHLGQLEYEKDYNAKDTSRIVLHFDGEGVVMKESADGAMSRDAVAKQAKAMFAKYPKQWTVFDRCDVKLGKAINHVKPIPLDALITDCVTVARLGDQVTVTKQRFHRVDNLDPDDPGKKNVIRELHHHGTTRKLAGF